MNSVLSMSKIFFQQIQDIPNIPQSIVTTACHEGSCFRSNLEFYNDLRQIRDLTAQPTKDGLHQTAYIRYTTVDGITPVIPLKLDLTSYPPFTEHLIQIICLEDTEGSGCHVRVNEAAKIYPALDGSSLEIDPCTDTCLIPLTRLYGTILYSEGIKRNNPNDIQLGTLLKLYSRYYCQRMHTGALCGGILFRQNKVHNVIEYIPARPIEYPNCRCPLVHIGDGDCDQSCFNAACGWDKFDCLSMNLNNNLWRNLEVIYPTTNTNHPFKENFICSKEATHPYRLLIEDALDIYGCCAAAALEMQRELLRVDLVYATEPLHRVEHSRGYSLSSDRSISWLEQICGVSMDRACSRGLRRPVLHLNFKFDNLNYNDLFGKDVPIGHQLEVALRHQIADFAGLPLSDIIGGLSWPGSVEMEFAIDAGLSATNTYEALQRAIENGELAKVLESVVRSFNAEHVSSPSIPVISGNNTDITVNNTDVTVDSGSIMISSEQTEFDDLSSERAAALPLTGSFDMENLLTRPRTCPHDLGLTHSPNDDGLSIDGYYSAYDITSISMDLNDGALRTVSCSTGQSPVWGTGSTPEMQSPVWGTGNNRQIIICNKGRWVPADSNEKKLECRIGCGPYNTIDLLSNGYIVTGVGDTHAATRTISCDMGYQPTRSSMSQPATLKCHNGKWENLSLECELIADIARGVCGQIMLSDLGRELRSEKIFVSHGIVRMTIWRLGCERGFIKDSGLEPFGVVCFGDALYALGTLMDLELIELSNDETSDMKTQIQIEIQKLIDNDTIPLLLLNDVDEFQGLKCIEDIRVPFHPTTSRGLSDGLLIGAIFGGSFGVLAIGAVVAYLWRTKCGRLSHIDGKPEAENKWTGVGYDFHSKDFYSEQTGSTGRHSRSQSPLNDLQGDVRLNHYGTRVGTAKTDVTFHQRPDNRQPGRYKQGATHVYSTKSLSQNDYLSRRTAPPHDFAKYNHNMGHGMEDDVGLYTDDTGNVFYLTNEVKSDNSSSEYYVAAPRNLMVPPNGMIPPNGIMYDTSDTSHSITSPQDDDDIRFTGGITTNTGIGSATYSFSRNRDGKNVIDTESDISDRSNIHWIDSSGIGTSVIDGYGIDRSGIDRSGIGRLSGDSIDTGSCEVLQDGRIAGGVCHGVGRNHIYNKRDDHRNRRLPRLTKSTVSVDRRGDRRGDRTPDMACDYSTNEFCYINDDDIMSSTEIPMNGKWVEVGTHLRQPQELYQRSVSYNRRLPAVSTSRRLPVISTSRRQMVYSPRLSVKAVCERFNGDQSMNQWYDTSRIKHDQQIGHFESFTSSENECEHRHTAEYNTDEYNTAEYNTAEYDTTEYDTAEYDTAGYNTCG